MVTSVMNATCRTVIFVAAMLAAGLCQREGLAQTALELTRVATGLSSPLYATSAPGDPQRLYVVEKTGAIKIVNLITGSVAATPFMSETVTAAGIGLTTDSERGLLGLAFHPDYQTNGRFFINSTDSAGNTRIREFRRLTADQVDSTSGREVLSITQPYSNHNGGWLDFGRDRHLYIAMGDGGSSNDPQNYAQNRGSLLGKMLRIDVSGDDFPADATRNYRVPATNPFVGQAGMLGEIWAYGLRNPWRNSFDRATGDLYIGDVGQSAREEINFQPATSSGGENYGWRVREGMVTTGLTGQDGSPLINPIYDYTRGTGTFQGQSVTGGYVYRGPLTALEGQYFFGDYVRGRLFSLVFNGTTPAAFNGTNFSSRTDWTASTTTTAGTIGNISSFGEDTAGNVYLVSFGGSVFRIGLPALSWSLGGTGTWSGTATNWTTGSGSAAAWTSQRRAVFTAPDGVIRLAGDTSVGLGLEFRGRTTRLEGAAGRLLLTGSTRALNQIDVAASGTAVVAAAIVAGPGFVKTGGGRLVVSGSSGPTGTAVVRGGELVVAGGLALASGTVEVDPGGTLRLTDGLSASLGGLVLDGGLVDVAKGRFVVRPGSFDMNAFRAALAAGRGSGDWRGTSGVTSSAIAGVAEPRTVGWLLQGDGSLTFAFAAPGDANLDWQIDILDAANILGGGKFDTGSPAIWNQGDFGYDGIVDILDVADFLATGLFDAGGYNGAAAAPVVNAVPEPGIPAIWLAVVTGAAAVRRRLQGPAVLAAGLLRGPRRGRDGRGSRRRTLPA
jgi:autotransporter-associated beta strand protein